MEMIDIANNDANTVLNALEAGLKKASSDTERGQKYSLGKVLIGGPSIKGVQEKR